MSTSRRDFFATSAGALLAAAFARPAQAGAWWQQAQPVFTPLRRNVGTFTMSGGTVGWLVNPGGVVVIDSQFPTGAKALIEGLGQRSNSRPVDILFNTHHHGDHTGGNITFRGVAKRVVAHANAAAHMRQPPGGQPPADQLYPDGTFTETWTEQVGDERVAAKYYGRAHTSGDAVITFERANVVHMGDLMFHQRHPVVDRAAGALLRNWMMVLDAVARDHDADTLYIFGHANTGLPVTGSRADLARFRDYIGALLAFAESQLKAGRSREEVLAMREPLKGYEAFGAFGQSNPRDALTVAVDEITAEGR